MVGKDVRFHKQYILDFKGISKKGGFVESQTYAEDLMDSMVGGFCKGINTLKKTQQLTLEIKKIK